MKIEIQQIEAWPALLAKFGTELAVSLVAHLASYALYDAFKKNKEGKPEVGVRVWKLPDKYKYDAKEIAKGSEFKLLKKEWNKNDTDYVIAASQTGKHYYLIKVIGDNSEVEKALKRTLDERSVSEAIQKELRNLGFDITVPQPVNTSEPVKREKKKEKKEEERFEIPEKRRYAEIGREGFDTRLLIIAGVGVLSLLALAFLLRK